MLSCNEYIATILLGCLAFVKTQICDLDCGPGYRCALRLSTCDYPPCPTFPTCATDGLPVWALVNTERPGQCPKATSTGPCIDSCRVDNDCPQHQKCCVNDCGKTCKTTVNNAVKKPGTCAQRLRRVTGSCQRECNVDSDCLGLKKCCLTSCGAICSSPCYFLIEPNHMSNRKKSAFWKLPFICRF